MNVAHANPAQPSLPKKGIYRILVCRPNHRLGNMLLLTPLITELEHTFKGAEIDILAEGAIAAEVFCTSSSVRNIYCLPKRGFKHPWAFLALLLRIRKTRYDLIVDPCLGSNFSRAMTRLLDGRCKLGFAERLDGSGLTHAVPPAVAMPHMAKRAINLVRWATGRDDDGFPPMDIRLTALEHEQGQRLLAGVLPQADRAAARPLVGIFANATGAKRYPLAWWREFIATLTQRLPHASIVEFVPMHGQSMLDSAWPAYYSSDIRRMGAVMAAADLLVSADCGVMHLAVASGVPTMGLFCVTDPAVYEPYGHDSGALHTGALSAAETADKVVDACAGILARASAAPVAASGQGAAPHPVTGPAPARDTPAVAALPQQPA
ncbi:MAG: glycosyltransferase family 9 protein [Pseudomonadota bacterium]|nr:glycosyltransferase family 9 protein [Pseudomonadota bacterium]